MKKYILGVGALILIIGGVWWYSSHSAPAAASATAPGAKPWVEVTSPSATMTDSTGATSQLNTGDEIAAGDVIKTDGGGVVVIHFADGSFAKLDPNSSMTITQADYDDTSGASNVHMTLSAGTLWSKVLDLVGANSSWQVQTSNAVATVRGTSFVTITGKGFTKVAGIEHTVAVAPLASTTVNETPVTPDAEVTIADTQLPGLTSGKIKLATTTVSADITGSTSYNTFTQEAAQFDTLRDSLQTQDGTGIEFRNAFRAAEVKDFTTQILEQRTMSSKSSDQTEVTTPVVTPTDTSTKTTDTSGIPPKTTTPTPSQPATPPTPAPQSTVSGTTEATPVSLTITSDTDLTSTITDGDTITFHAIMTYSDATKKDVTSSVAWAVINNIGTFPTPGTFHVTLPSNYAELGQVAGAVYASYKGANGKEINAASPEFTVHAYIPPQTDTDG